MSIKSGFVYETGLDQPAQFAAAVTPSDSTDLTNKTRALYIGTAGTLSVVMDGDGATVSFPSVQAGLLPIRVRRVNSTGTSASNIVALF